MPRLTLSVVLALAQRERAPKVDRGAGEVGGVTDLAAAIGRLCVWRAGAAGSGDTNREVLDVTTIVVGAAWLTFIVGSTRRGAWLGTLGFVATFLTCVEVGSCAQNAEAVCAVVVSKTGDAGVSLGVADAAIAILGAEALHAGVGVDVTNGCLSATRIITWLALVGLAFIFRHIHFWHVFYRAVIAAHIGHG